jgi:Domain of unknown function (DUF4277)
MESGSVERSYHFWVFTSFINDLGRIETVDVRLGRRDQEESTAGEAVAGMPLNGLGLSNRPRSCIPQFFANKILYGIRSTRPATLLYSSPPMDLLREGVCHGTPETRYQELDMGARTPVSRMPFRREYDRSPCHWCHVAVDGGRMAPCPPPW